MAHARSTDSAPGVAILAAAVFAASADGCHSYKRSASPEAAVASARSGRIQVTRTDHSVVVVDSASVVGDSIIGVSGDRSRDRIAIPLSQVRSVASERVDAARSAALGAGVLLGLIALLGIAAAVALANVSF